MSKLGCRKFVTQSDRRTKISFEVFRPATPSAPETKKPQCAETLDQSGRENWSAYVRVAAPSTVSAWVKSCSSMHHLCWQQGHSRSSQHPPHTGFGTFLVFEEHLLQTLCPWVSHRAKAGRDTVTHCTRRTYLVASKTLMSFTCTTSFGGIVEGDADVGSTGRPPTTECAGGPRRVAGSRGAGTEYFPLFQSAFVSRTGASPSHVQ